MKSTLGLGLSVIAITLALTACEPERVVIESGPAGFAGYHVGYSWAGEASGTAFEDAGSYIETILLLDEDAIIRDAKITYWQRVDGYWTTRQAGNAFVTVDFTVTPTAATLGSNYRPGASMFSIYSVNPMSFYAAAVSDTGVPAVMIVEPLTRYRFELRFPAGFDFRTTMGELTLGSGMAVPTTRESGGAFLNPGSWSELEGKHIFDFHRYSHVLSDRGVFEGISGSSSVREFLQRMGVTFTGDRPEPMPVRYGYFGIGGWSGNYSAIADYLIGRNARNLRSLVDWAPERFAAAINDNNVFGVDVPTGATRTVQNSFDGISGATVRMSRESTSYQRALVNAGIVSESDVIIGRF